MKAGMNWTQKVFIEKKKEHEKKIKDVETYLQENKLFPDSFDCLEKTHKPWTKSQQMTFLPLFWCNLLRTKKGFAKIETEYMNLYETLLEKDEENKEDIQKLHEEVFSKKLQFMKEFHIKPFDAASFNKNSELIFEHLAKFK
jgi:hypothetical protein